MTPIEFFKVGCKAGRYKEKAWVYSIFGCTRPRPDQTPKPYDVVRVDGIPYWVSSDGTPQAFDNYANEPDTPLLDFREDIDLVVGDIPNLSEPVKTLVGNYFINWYTLVTAFGSKIPFQAEEITNKALLKLIHPLFTSDILHPNGELNVDAEDPTKIYVHEYVRYVQCMTALAGFVEISVPSATPYTATTSPEVLKLRKQLLEQYKDQLMDPTVVAEIERQLIAEDKKWIAQDPDRGFYIKGKSFDVVRKKLFLLGGIEQSFSGDGTYTVVTTSLSEGHKVKDLPALINTLRSGSYSRGALTALGGEAVKFFQRVLQNTRIGADDCGVVYGVPYEITEHNHSNYAGRYYVENGETLPIGEDTKRFIGKVVELRSPQACKLPYTDYCAKCMGDNVARSETGLSAMGSAVGSQFLSASMGAVHGFALKVVHYDPNVLIS